MGWYRKFWLQLAPLVALTLVGGSIAQGATRDVCKSGCAFTTIQSAIDATYDAASSGDTVRVHDGIYVESINFRGVAVAVRSVNGPGTTTIDAAGTDRVVTFASGEGSDSILDGFTLTNGAAESGGGISCVSASPTIANCVVSGNSADFGGGIYCQLSSPTISGCTITNNTAAVSGGGIHAYDTSSPEITGCTISGNSATGKPGFLGQGGGVYSYNATPQITDSTISGNNAADAGGGIFGQGSVGPALFAVTNTTISGNSAGNNGGGVVLYSFSTLLDRVTISGNSAGSDGGGIWVSLSGSAPTITNATVTGNTASGNGGGLFINASTSAISHSTFSGNRADGSGGGIRVEGTLATTVYNSVLWGDAATSNSEISYSGSNIAVAYSVVKGGFPGSNNTGALRVNDPQFIDPRAADEAPTTAGDYRLLASSPCKDSGTSDTTTYPSLTLPGLDRGGDPRPQRNGYDRGSDEYALLFNGSFEEVDERVPVPWAARRLQTRDGLVNGTARNGSRSFLINGTAAAKSLTQTLDVAGAAGDTFTLAGASMAQRPNARGGFYGLTLQIFYTDGRKKVYRSGFTKRTHDWERQERVFVAAKRYNKVVVSLVYAGQKGQAWFDDVSLFIQPASLP